MKNEDEKYIARCIQLAKNGQQGAAPNPMVGAVIVYAGQIIGEGFHIRCGEAHAEVNAIQSVKDKTLLPLSTIYVSLEPCSHYGKTPPCADLIIKHRIKRVVVGCVDPFPKVAGRGIQKLRAAGIDVTVGVLEEQCIALNQQFITSNLKKRPYIILKWAESADHFIDKKRTGGTPVIFSTNLSHIITHKRRAESMAILVGGNTALLDNPSLSTRHWGGKNPIRVVIDRSRKLPLTLQLFDGTIPTLCFTEKEEKVALKNVTFVQLNQTESVLSQLLHYLNTHKIQTLLVEGGALLLQLFIQAKLWDEAHVESSPLILEDGVKAPQINSFKRRSIEQRKETIYLHYYRGDCQSIRNLSSL